MRKLTVVAVHPIHYNDYLFNALHEAGVDVDVYYTKPSLVEYPWKNYLHYHFKRPKIKSWLSLFIFRRILTHKNDIFLFYGWDSVPKNMMLLFSMLFCRDYLVFTDTFQSNNEVRSFIKKHIRSFWLKQIFRNATYVLTTGKIGINKITEFYKDSNVVNFPFCTDINFFDTVPDFTDFGKEIVFFSSGRLDNNHKGYDVAIKALHLLKKHDVRFTYYIAGVGRDHDMLVALCKEYDLAQEVVFLGWQELDSLKKHYSSAHIFLHTSHFDPYPNAILEAMASGLVVVSSDKAGSAVDRIDHGKNGYIFEDNDVQGLTNILCDIAKLDMDSLKKISAAALQTSHYWDVQYNVDVLKRILQTDK